MSNIQTEISLIQKQILALPINFHDTQQLLLKQPVSPDMLAINIIKFMVDIDKIKNIFLNTVKLNQKVYSSIVQRQVNISNDATNLLNSTLISQKKCQQTLKQTKTLYQQTIHQNQKARFLLQQFLNPIREQLKSKVDETTFSLQMKMILDQYDQIGHKITYDNQQQRKKKQENKKTISSETLLFLKNQILPILSNMESQVLINTQQIAKNSQKIQYLNSKSNFFGTQLQKYQNQLQIVQNRLFRELNNKTSDPALQKKFKQYANRFINESLQGSIKSIKTVEKQIRNMGSQIKVSIEFIKNTNASIIQKSTKMQKQINSCGNNILSINNIVQQKMSKFDRIAQMINSQTFAKGSSALLEQKIVEIENKIGSVNEISQNLKESLLKDMGSNLVGKINQIQNQMKQFNQFNKKIQSKIQNQNGQISCIRDMLSKKANFSDVLIHIQSKVDKQQFKNLKNHLVVRSGSTQLKTKELVLRETDITQEFSRKNSSFNRRSFLTPRAGQKQSQQSQQTKRFKLGYTAQFKDRNYWKTYKNRGNLNRTNIFSNQNNIINQ